MIFPNYIYSNILENIINYIYNNNSTNYYFMYSIYSLNNESINYACVCKKWFTLVQDILSNQINLNNYKILKPLIEIDESELPTNTTPNSTTTTTSTNQFKLIKIQNSVKIFDSIIDYERLTSNNKFNSNLYKKIIIPKENKINSLGILTQLPTYPDNMEFNFSIHSTQFELIIKKFQQESSVSRSFQNISNNNNNIISEKDLNKIKSNCIYGFQKDDIKSLFNLLKTNIKEFNFKDYGYFNDFFTFDLVFEKRNENHKIGIDDLVFKKSDYKVTPDQSLSKLNKFIYKIGFKKLLKTVKSNLNFNNNVSSSNNNDSNDITENQALEFIINKLSNDSTLKSIKIYHKCYNTCSCKLEASVYSTFKSILSNSNCKVESLFLDITIRSTYILALYEGISNNNSIKQLSMNHSLFNQIIRKGILIKNKSIRNIYVEGKNDYLDLESLNLLRNSGSGSDKIDLYSITFDRLSGLDGTNKYIALIKENNYPVKEFNFLVNIFYQAKKHSYQIITNNSIINVATDK